MYTIPFAVNDGCSGYMPHVLSIGSRTLCSFMITSVAPIIYRLSYIEHVFLVCRFLNPLLFLFFCVIKEKAELLSLFYLHTPTGFFFFVFFAPTSCPLAKTPANYCNVSSAVRHAIRKHQELAFTEKAS